MQICRAYWRCITVGVLCSGGPASRGRRLGLRPEPRALIAENGQGRAGSASAKGDRLVANDDSTVSGGFAASEDSAAGGELVTGEDTAPGGELVHYSELVACGERRERFGRSPDKRTHL